jgi:seryl-tRNA synthetase
MDWMPNIPHKDMPAGKNEHDNPVLKAWVPGSGYIDNSKLGKVGEDSGLMPAKLLYADKEFKPVHHLDLGMKLGVIDNDQAAKVTGTRFTYIVGELALLQFALQKFFFDELLKRGYKYIIPPLLVREKALYGTSHFPEQVDQVYKIQSEDVEENQQLFLLGSSEPANFSYFMDKTLDEAELPYKLFAYTSCFRSEAGSWGRDTKGIKRMHQFDKIEMNVVCTPEQADQTFDELLAVNEWLLQQLELPYHLALKCTGDAGYQASAKQIDPEVWLTGQQEFMEVMTDTNATDFQARRLNIKYKAKDGKKYYVNTVNDTGIAMGRMLVAIMDNYQQSDGTVKIPKVLVPYFGKEYLGK